MFLNICDSEGTLLNPGNVVTYEGQEARVLALWVDPRDGTDTTITIIRELYKPVERVRVRGRDLTIDWKQSTPLPKPAPEEE